VNYRRVSLLVMVLLAGVALQRTRPVSGDEWQPISQEELKMTSEPLAPGAAAIYLYRQVDRNDSNRASTEYNYVRIKILTEEGRKYANVEIPFTKGRTNVSNIRARTIRPDGSAVNFDGKVFENAIVKSKTLKYEAKTFTIPNVEVGGIIEYHYNYDFEDNYIFSSHWILSEELFTKRAAFTLKPYMRYPWRVQWIAPAGLPQGTEQAKEGPDHVIRMITQNVPAFQMEDHMPPPNELKFRVDFIYHDEVPEQNPDKFWKRLGRKQNDRVESFVSKRKALEQAVAQIVSPSDSPEEKLRKIYARTQQIHNLSYEVRKSEQEVKRDKQKEIKDAEDLLKEGYGSGWDITWLFLGLARAAGFEAYPVLISNRAEYFFVKQRLNSNELNANVVLVKLNGKDMYFDPGAAFTAFGLLPWGETATEGLKLDKDGGSWVQTTLPDSDVSRIERSAKLKLSSEGVLEGKVKLTFAGLEASSRRIEERNEDDTERKKSLEEQVKEYIPAGIEVELTNKPEWNASETPLVAEFDLKVPGWVASASRRALFPVGLFGASEKHLFEHSNRVWPVYFRYPYKMIDDLTIELPAGWQVGAIPKELDQNAKAAEYSLKVENKEGLLHIRRELRSDLMMVPKETYPVLRSFFQLVKSQDDQQVVLQPGGTSANN
jgi:transglutaminase-like putative cysteine protease